jgi:hypothetical protein
MIDFSPVNQWRELAMLTTSLRADVYTRGDKAARWQLQSSGFRRPSRGIS